MCITMYERLYSGLKRSGNKKISLHNNFLKIKRKYLMNTEILRDRDFS